MFAVISSIFHAFGGLFARGMGKIFFACVALTLIFLIALSSGFTWATGALLEYYQHELPAFLAWILNIFGAYLAILFLFPILMPILVSFFDEQIADTVERDAYPALVIGTPAPLWEDLKADIAFTLKALLLNLAILPLFLAGPLYIIAYYLLNSYLLGTQFFMMAGGRHIGKHAARMLADRHRSKIMVAGGAIILAAQIPILFLVAPLWGVALMVHLYQRISPPPQVLTQE